MIFWIWASLLALAAIGFVLAPSLRRHRDHASGDPAAPANGAGQTGGPLGVLDRRRSGGNRDSALRRLYRQRLEELEDEAAAGIVEASSRAEVERELDRGLLDEFGGGDSAAQVAIGSDRRSEALSRGGGERAESAGAPPDSDEMAGSTGADGMAAAPSKGFGAWFVAAIGIAILAPALYLQVGEPDAGLLRNAVDVLQLDPDRDRLELDRWRVLLAERAERLPEDAQSRYLLGRIGLMDGEYRSAAQSFSEAHAIVGDDPGIDLVWLQALYLGNAGRLDEAGKAIAERILAREPDNSIVLEITAFDAYRRGDFRESVQQFDRALGQAVEPVRRAALDLFLKQARSELGDLGPVIDVAIDALETPPATATLYVIARPAGGGMPFAVVRRAAAPLPEAVRLDDAVSMNPALPLSAAGAVEVVVRISLTGAAARHPGDWEWQSEPFSVAAAGKVELVARLAPPPARR